MDDGRPMNVPPHRKEMGVRAATLLEITPTPIRVLSPLVERPQRDVLAVGQNILPVDGRVDLGSRVLLVPVVSGPMPVLRVDYRVASTMVTAVGRSVRPTLQRSSTRKPCTMPSKHLALIQRCVCWKTAGHGGKLVGSSRHGTPAKV